MLIKQSKQFHLDAQVTQQGKLHSFTLHQLWPEAQRPHWRRVLQMNLTGEELTALGRFLVAAGASSTPEGRDAPSQHRSAPEAQESPLAGQLTAASTGGGHEQA